MSPASPLSAAQAARKALADRLTEIRKDAGINGRELSARCEYTVAATAFDGRDTGPDERESEAQVWVVDAVTGLAARAGGQREVGGDEVGIGGVGSSRP